MRWLQKRSTHCLLKYLGIVLGVQVVISLFFVGSALLKNDTEVDSTLSHKWSKAATVTSEENDIRVLAERPTQKQHTQLAKAAATVTSENNDIRVLLAETQKQHSRYKRLPPQNIKLEPVVEVSRQPPSMPKMTESIVNSEDVSKKAKPIPELQNLEPIRIVQWTSGRPEGVLKGCDVPCEHLTDKSQHSLESASAVIFSIPSYGGNPKHALRNVSTAALTVALSMESSEYYRRQKDLSDYDLTITCSFDSDLTVTYYGWAYDLLLNVSDWPWERREKAIVFVARNCHSKSRRETLIKMLEKYVRIDSVSSCLNNHPWPPDIPRKNKDDLQKRYLMYLAAENSIEKDYVTEKVYGGLINGAVPLYLGAPNVKEFVPTHSVIKIPSNFTESDVIQLSEKIKKIFTNKTAYEEWIEFKNHPYEEWFKRKFSISRTHIWCRLCRKIFAMKNGYGWDKELQEIVFDN